MEQLKGLAHVAILTKDMQESIAFYEKLGGVLQQTDTVQKPTGFNKLAMVVFHGILLELIEPHDGTEVNANGGVIPHIAFTVEDLQAAAAEIRAAGIDTFLKPEPTVLPDLFGGLQNWFFTGPSGEQIELLQKL